MLSILVQTVAVVKSRIDKCHWTLKLRSKTNPIHFFLFLKKKANQGSRHNVIIIANILHDIKGRNVKVEQVDSHWIQECLAVTNEKQREKRI